MTAIIIKHHPKMLQRWATNIVHWYKTQGPNAVKERTKFLSSEDVEAANPTIKKEFVKQGFKL
jgi:hypothetical protein